MLNKLTPDVVDIYAKEILTILKHELDTLKSEIFDDTDLTAKLKEEYFNTEAGIKTFTMLEVAKALYNENDDIMYRIDDQINSYINTKKYDLFKSSDLLNALYYRASDVVNTIKSFIISSNETNREDLINNYYSKIKAELIRLYNN